MIISKVFIDTLGLKIKKTHTVLNPTPILGLDPNQLSHGSDRSDDYLFLRTQAVCGRYKRENLHRFHVASKNLFQ